MIKLEHGRAQDSQAGFTIIEFMVSSAVFGVVLLVVTVAMLFMNNSYQRSLYTSRTQAAASNLVDVAAQAVKYSNSYQQTGDAFSGTGSYCLGGRQFLYIIGKQIDGGNTDTTTRNAVLTRISDVCDTPSIRTTSPGGGAIELLGKGMRLGKFEIKPAAGGMYVVTARVIYGDDDVLCSDNVSGSCTGSADLTAQQLSDKNIEVRCRPGTGSQFCAVSELSATVYQRL